MGDSSLDKNEYRKYRTAKDDDEPYFPTGTVHENEEVTLNGTVFSWDKPKNDANKATHGIDFYTAICVFNNECYLEAESYICDGELRSDIIGEPMEPPVKGHSIDTSRATPKAVQGKDNGILFVTFTENETDKGNVNRIISARPATKKEAEDYKAYTYGF